MGDEMGRKRIKQIVEETGEDPRKPVPRRNDPWISKRTGFTVMTIMSLAMAAYMGYVVYTVDGFWQGLLWAGITAGAIWGVFFLSYSFNTIMRR